MTQQTNDDGKAVLRRDDHGIHIRYATAAGLLSVLLVAATAAAILMEKHTDPPALYALRVLLGLGSSIALLTYLALPNRPIKTRQKMVEDLAPAWLIVIGIVVVAALTGVPSNQTGLFTGPIVQGGGVVTWAAFIRALIVSKHDTNNAKTLRTQSPVTGDDPKRALTADSGAKTDVSDTPPTP